MRVVLSRRANSDLMAQIDWLEAMSPDAAQSARETIKDSLRALAQFPMAGFAVGDEREWPIWFGRDGFVVVYRVRSDRVEIGRIFHSRQNRD